MEKVCFLFVGYQLPRAPQHMCSPSLLGVYCAGGPQLSLPRSCLQSERAVFPKVMPSSGQPTSNKGSMWSHGACSLPQLQTTLKGHPFYRVPCGVSEGLCYSCILHHSSASPATHSSWDSWNLSPINLPRAKLHSRMYFQVTKPVVVQEMVLGRQLYNVVWSWMTS